MSNKLLLALETQIKEKRKIINTINSDIIKLKNLQNPFAKLLANEDVFNILNNIPLYKPTDTLHDIVNEPYTNVEPAFLPLFNIIQQLKTFNKKNINDEKIIIEYKEYYKNELLELNNILHNITSKKSTNIDGSQVINYIILETDLPRSLRAYIVNRIAPNITGELIFNFLHFSLSNWLFDLISNHIESLQIESFGIICAKNDTMRDLALKNIVQLQNINPDYHYDDDNDYTKNNDIFYKFINNLIKNKTIKCLIFKDLFLSHTGTNCLIEGLKNNKSLKTIIICNIFDKPKYIIDIFDILKYNTTIETLDISSSTINRETIDNIINTLTNSNNTLNTLIMNDTIIHTDNENPDKLVLINRVLTEYNNKKFKNKNLAFTITLNTPRPPNAMINLYEI